MDDLSGAHSESERVETWLRNVNFALQEEPKVKSNFFSCICVNCIQPVAETIGNSTTKRVGYPADWQNVRSIKKFLSQQQNDKTDPFLLYFGIYLPHPYQTPSAGVNAGASTYKSSPYYLSKLNESNIEMPKWKPFEKEHPVKGFINIE